MDLAELGFKIDTTGIKRATDELDKMGKKGYGATNQASIGLGKMGFALTALMTAAAATAAAIGAATAKTLEFARTLNNATNALNTSSEAMQIWMRGAQSLGVEGDKIRDIFKDINDKLVTNPYKGL